MWRVCCRPLRAATRTTPPRRTFRLRTTSQGWIKTCAASRWAFPSEYLKGLNPETGDNIQKGIDLLAKLGCEVVPISLPHTDYAIACYYIICTAEASSNLARYDGVRYGFRSAEHADLQEMYKQTRYGGFGAEVKRRIMLGTYVLSSGYYDAYYLKAQKVRTLITRDFLEAFDEVDVIVTPTSPIPAFKLGERMDDPLQMYLADIYTVTASLAGIPGISVPCGKTKGGTTPSGGHATSRQALRRGKAPARRRCLRKSRWV